MQTSSKSPFVFGIYPFSATGTVHGLATGRPDDMREIGKAITDLAQGKPILPRMYFSYAGLHTVSTVLDQIAPFARGDLHWDIVLHFQAPGKDMSPWTNLIRTIVRQFGKNMAALQITSESNLPGMPGSADGSWPGVQEALVRGVMAAREEVAASGATARIGFAVVPTFAAQDAFWRSLSALAPTITGKPDAFARALDYVGIDMYPDVFGPPIPTKDLGAAVNALLARFRNTDLPTCGISGSVPIRITENGWPTAGPGRTEAKQAEALEAIIRAVYAGRAKYNVTHYELFSLRDADSSRDDLFHRFGLVRDDYSRKPAFAVYRRLIAELSS